MPAKGKQQNKNSDKKKKRKQISPLSTASVCTLDTTRIDNKETCETGSTKSSQQGNTPTQQNVEEVNKRLRYKSSSPEYFLFETQQCYNQPNMNYPQHPQQQSFSGQYMQSPPGAYSQVLPPTLSTLQTPTLQNAQPISSTQPPQWAINMMDEIKCIKENVTKIQTIEKTVNSINMQLTDLRSKVSDIDKRVVEVESSMKFVSDKHDQNTKDLKVAHDTIKNLETKCSNLESTMKDMKSKNDEMKDRVLDGEYRSMRNNLIFYGITEPASGEGAGRGETDTCEKAVKGFITDRLSINCEEMVFERAHYLGNPTTAKKPRPIIVKFNKYKDCERVRSAAQSVKNDLRKSNHGVGVQLPKEWREARKPLYTKMTEEREKGNTAKFIGDKLFINGNQYKPASNNGR